MKEYPLGIMAGPINLHTTVAKMGVFCIFGHGGRIEAEPAPFGSAGIEYKNEILQ